MAKENMGSDNKPRIALVMGDPAGIGPELTVKLLDQSDIRAMADVVVVADKRVWQLGERFSGIDLDCQVITRAGEIGSTGDRVAVLETPCLPEGEPQLGRVSLESGRYELACLTRALDLCREGHADAMCFAPLNKEAMHLAGLKHEDESGLFVEHLGHVGPTGILNTLGKLWTSRATSHVSLRQVCDLVSRESVVKAIRLLNEALKASGIANPKIAVAGLNPHAGDGGMFGNEEIDEIEPAVKQAAEEGISVEGPYPPDTIFLRGRDGEFDAVVTMYHDQGQIAMKLMGFDNGVTVHAGLPFPITTSAHGSAYNIAGKGIAKVNALRQAFLLACRMAKV